MTFSFSEFCVIWASAFLSKFYQLKSNLSIDYTRVNIPTPCHRRGKGIFEKREANYKK